MGEAIALAFGLAMDAAAIAAARGLSRQRGEIVILPLLFGAFQAGMAALGWFLGEAGGSYIAAFDHWVADEQARDFGELLSEDLDTLRALTAPVARAPTA